MINRLLEATLESSLSKAKKSIALLGPRQTGKSTLLRKLKPTLILDLADEQTFRDHLRDPSLIRALVEALPPNPRVLVDEIQRLPSLLNTIQSLIDQHRDTLFMLTGSSARKLRHGQVNLLPGRLFWHSLYPLTYWELQEQWSLERALTIGTLPEVWLNDYGPELLGNYINTYLREEIQAEALVRNLDSYARFLDLAAETSGQVINYTQLSSDAEIPKETLRRFYDILTDTLLIHRLPGFHDISGSRKAIQKEKFIFFDMGVRNAILKQHRNTFTSTQMGALFEQWLIAQVIAWANYAKKDWHFYFYRDDAKQEVDLIIDHGATLTAVEIKFSKTIKMESLRGLTAFTQYCKKPVAAFLVYCGELSQKRDAIRIMPYRAFLDLLATLS